MKNKTHFIAIGCAMLCLASTTSVLAAQQTKTPVLVELFTSEGCSDCPPADTLLEKLVNIQPVKGVEIIALEEHVDYFNNPAHWVDPFSSHQVTDRQYSYAAKFKDDSPYTPELVVDGSAHFVGSDEVDAISAITSAGRTPVADIHIDVSPAGAGTVNIATTVNRVPLDLSAEKVAVVLAVTEDGLTSHVTGGENSGKDLTHIAVIRSLSFLGYLGAKPMNSFISSVNVSNSAATHPQHVIVFLQDTVTKRIYGAAEQPL